MREGSTWPWKPLAVLCLGTLLTSFNVTSINIAIPSLQARLDAGLDSVTWILGSYTLALTALITTTGRLGDLLGQRNVFAVGMLLFGLGAAVCGAAPSVGVLIAGRAVQGSGAAAVLPQTMALVVRTIAEDKRGPALGLLGSVAGIGGVSALSVGGYLVTDFGWRSIFWINVPVCVLALAMAGNLPAAKTITRYGGLDFTGAALATATLLLVTFALAEGNRYHWGRVIGPVFIVSILLAGFFAGLLFVIHERWKQNSIPLLPFSLVANRPFRAMTLAAALISVALVQFTVQLSVYLQSVRSYTALEASIITLPLSLVPLVLGPIAGRLGDMFGPLKVMNFGLVAFSIGVALTITTIGATTDRVRLLIPLTVTGLGVGTVYAPVNILAMRGVPPDVSGAASGVLSTSRQFGLVLGAALLSVAVPPLLHANVRSQIAAVRSTTIDAPMRQTVERRLLGYANAQQLPVLNTQPGSSKSAGGNHTDPVAVALRNVGVRTTRQGLAVSLAALTLALMAGVGALERRTPSDRVGARRPSGQVIS